MLRKFVGMAALAGALLVAACNTVQGAGEDLQSASNAVEEEIEQ